MPLCGSWPIPVTDSPNTGLKKMSKVKPHRWLETSRNMFKHFVREGHADRSSLRQSTQDGCLQSIKCRRCQSVGMSKIEDGTGHVTRWLLSMWTFLFYLFIIYFYIPLPWTGTNSEHRDRLYGSNNNRSNCLGPCMTNSISDTRRWRNHMQHDMSFFLFNKLTRRSPEWRLSVRAGVSVSVKAKWGWKINTL